MEMKGRSEPAREKRGGQQEVMREEHSRRRILAGAKRRSLNIKVKGQRKRRRRKTFKGQEKLEDKL